MIANAAIAVGFFPWALILLQRAVEVGGHFWAPYPSPDVIYWELYSLLGGRLVAAALLIGAGVALGSNFSASVVLLFWAVAPAALALIEFLVSTPIFLDRYFIGSLPALFTLAAVGAAHLLSCQKWPTTVGAAVVLAATIVGNLPYDTDHHDDWRTAAAYLQDHLQNSDCVLVYPILILFRSATTYDENFALSCQLTTGKSTVRMIRRPGLLSCFRMTRCQRIVFGLQIAFGLR